MRNFLALLAFVVLIRASCGGETLLAASSTVLLPGGSSPASTTTVFVLGVDEQVTGTLKGDEFDLLFALTAPADGALVVHLSWDGSLRNLELYLEDEVFFALPPEWSSTIGALQVVAGRTYRVWVSDAARWDYGSLDVPFVLTTSLQPELPVIPINDCTTSQPAVNWPCVNGGWVPPGHPLAQGAAPPPVPPLSVDAIPLDHLPVIADPASSPLPPPVAPPPVPGPVGCTTVQPAQTWVCVNGGWLPPDHPLAIPVPPPPLPSPTGCATPDPFIGIPGLVGVCVLGGWVPIGHPLTGGG